MCTKYRMLDNIQTIERQILSAITSVGFVSVKSKDGDLHNVSLSIQTNEKSSVNTNREIERASERQFLRKETITKVEMQ